jgi:hypothetical protein
VYTRIPRIYCCIWTKSECAAKTKSNRIPVNSFGNLPCSFDLRPDPQSQIRDDCRIDDDHDGFSNSGPMDECVNLQTEAETLSQ